MSQTHTSNSDGVHLFACTKCNSRHPFEDLSQGHQLCKACKGSFQVIKCNYCRSEFQQETASKSSNCICKKCDSLQEQHGKPGPCAYCNVIAAFIGTKCQRCTNSEKRYGPPMSCEHCRQKCAFDRKDPESKKKVDGKILCWLCTMAYKRTLAKARQKEAILKSTLGGSSSYSHHRMNGGGNSKSYSSFSTSTGSNNHQRHNHNSSSSNHDPHKSGLSSSHRSHHKKHSHHQSSSSHMGVDHCDSSSLANKKQRMDLTGSSNGHLSSSLPMLSSLSDNRFIDPNNGSDLASVITQLKDQVSALNKRIQLKDKELLSKDQQIADLKSTNTREQRELREKISSLQKQHNERISEMQAKLVAMQKQIASQTRTSRVNTGSAIIEPPLVI